eukprot:6473354-Prorocentrum_lima.AAC.1
MFIAAVLFVRSGKTIEEYFLRKLTNVPLQGQQEGIAFRTPDKLERFMRRLPREVSRRGYNRATESFPQDIP